MNSIRQTKVNGFDVFEILNESSQTSMKVVPERGGIITELRLRGDELLYINEETLFDREANVRGGIPILFPISGQLDNGKYEWNSETYTMRNHGVARNNPWKVLETTESTDELSMTVMLKSNEHTRQEFPFDFELFFKYILEDHQLTIEQEFRNLSDTEMPMYPGFHPYFKSTSKVCDVATNADSYLDYNDMEIKPYKGSVDLTGMKEAVVLLGAETTGVSFSLPHVKNKVSLEYGEEFKYVVLWTEQGKNFVCIEPWMAKNKELHRKEELVYVAPGESLKTYFRIGIQS